MVLEGEGVRVRGREGVRVRGCEGARMICGNVDRGEGVRMMAAKMVPQSEGATVRGCEGVRMTALCPLPGRFWTADDEFKAKGQCIAAAALPTIGPK